METLTQTQEQTATPPKLDDGLTDNLPPIQPLEMTPQAQAPQTATSGTASAACSDLYTKEEFYEQFKSVFQFAGDFTGTASLPIQPNEEISARAAASRIYAMAEKYAFLRFIIDRRSSAMGETILAVQFLFMKASAVYAEKKNRKLGGDLWAKLFRRKAKAKDTAYSAPVDPEKQQKQEN